jgi:hypothetical protein
VKQKKEKSAKDNNQDASENNKSTIKNESTEQRFTLTAGGSTC